MSDLAPPETPQFGELQRLVRRLGEELASYRKRALSAEARLKTLDEEAAAAVTTSPRRVKQLERENAELSKRLEAATERTAKMLARVRFLKQQKEGGA